MNKNYKLIAFIVLILSLTLLVSFTYDNSQANNISKEESNKEVLIPSEDDYKGFIESNRYKNEFFNISFTYPKNFKYFSEDENSADIIKTSIPVGLYMDSNDILEQKNAFTFVIKPLKSDLDFSKNYFNYFEGFRDEVENRLSNFDDLRLRSSLMDKKINNIDFKEFSLEYEICGIKFKESNYIALIDDYFIIYITTSSNSLEAEDSILEIVNSIQEIES